MRRKHPCVLGPRARSLGLKLNSPKDLARRGLAGLTQDSVGHAARIAAWLETGKKVDFFPLSVEFVAPEPEPVAA